MGRSIFIRNPKCATISIRSALERKGFNARVDEAGSHQTAAKWNRVISDYKKHFSFSVCRNPYDRLLSGWLFICRRKLDKHEKILEKYSNNFEAFVTNLKADFNMKLTDVDMVTWPQGKWFLDNGVCIVNEIGRFEVLDSWWADICRRKGWPIKGLMHSNKTTHGPWREYYTPRMMQVVNDQYTADFKLLNYKRL